MIFYVLYSMTSHYNYIALHYIKLYYYTTFNYIILYCIYYIILPNESIGKSSAAVAHHADITKGIN